MIKLYIFGNGNISFEDFEKEYLQFIKKLNWRDAEFHLADFRGADTMMMEYLKTKTSRVTVYHVAERPRYFPDRFRTFAGEWTVLGNYASDAERDKSMIQNCTHFLAADFNSDTVRKSGTAKNIDMCLREGKTDLKTVLTPLTNQ